MLFIFISIFFLVLMMVCMGLSNICGIVGCGFLAVYFLLIDLYDLKR